MIGFTVGLAVGGMGAGKGAKPSKSFQPKFAASAAPEAEVVDLLEAVLAHVGDRDPRLPGPADQIEGEPVRIAQAAGVHLIGLPGAVVSIWSSLPMSELILGVVRGVSGAAPVAGSRVEHPVRPELELPPLWFELRGAG